MGKEGGMINRPPLLDSSNYDFWKSRMATFLKSIDNKTWKAVLKGLEPPYVLDKDGNKTTVLKPEEDWSKEEDDAALGNNTTLNALFNGVDRSML
ncbi:gag-protease polyprotein [Trifolium repens]|nr:gag-protease polyprotein [Trifolium repens]